MFCDNESVVKFTSRAESTISNKHELILWHSVRESISSGWLRFLREPGVNNLASIFNDKLPILMREDTLNSIYSCNGKYVRDEG